MDNKQLIAQLRIAQNTLIKVDKQCANKSNEHYALYNLINQINRLSKKLEKGKLTSFDI